MAKRAAFWLQKSDLHPGRNEMASPDKLDKVSEADKMKQGVLFSESGFDLLHMCITPRGGWQLVTESAQP